MKTLNNTATAKHIAASSGLAFSYNRSRRVWELAARNGVANLVRTYAPSEVADLATDAFYSHCMEVAALNMTAHQMERVIVRAQYAAMSDRLNDGEQFAPNSADSLEFVRLACAATCEDRQVWDYENAMYNMIHDAEELSGTYAEHKRAFLAGVPSVAVAALPTVPEYCAISSYWTDGKPSRGIGQNKGRRTAIGYFEGKQAIMSFPPRLNKGLIPDLDDVAAILAGVSVAAACRAFNDSKADTVAAAPGELVRRVVRLLPGAPHGVALTVAGSFYVMWCGPRSHRLAVECTSPARLFAHWRGFVNACAAPSVYLVKADTVADLVAATAPPDVAAAIHATESNADTMARVMAVLRGRRLAEEASAARLACECHQCAVPEESDDEENARALQYEQDRAAAAARLAGSSK